ncbi:MAG: cell envelope integrity protein CreD [Alphaproteobacteria bacterium]|nr:cell envelope integrity protein CreD [Alphaproteobacteria bacterium]
MSPNRSPSVKLALAIVIGLVLSVPLFSVWLMVYDREHQSAQAKASIAEGWGGPQTLAGPLLVIPYRTQVTENAVENGKAVVHTREVWQRLTLSPETVSLATDMRPDLRKRSIYEVVVYEAAVRGKARFAMPADLSRFGVAAGDLALDRAELHFGVSDARGLGPNPTIVAGGQALRLQPGGGTAATGGGGFFSWIDARSLATTPMPVNFAYVVRGNGSLSLAPDAGETLWQLRSTWSSPSFQGGFLPADRYVGDHGFDARYRIGNLALGRSLVSTSASGERKDDPAGADAASRQAGVSLIQPVDVYSQVNRAAKYGFLFIGFTFTAFLLFDLIGGVRVSGVEYLLVGAALVLFFVLLLAFAEVIGFTPAYLVAAGAIVGLETAYSAAVLGSWRRATFIGALLGALYVILYVLLSLEAFSLLIGSLMLFAALAAVMYLTRNLNWGAKAEVEAQA